MTTLEVSDFGWVTFQPLWSVAGKSLCDIWNHDREWDLPREACGLILMTSLGLSYMKCNNVHPTPHDSFQIRRDDFAWATEHFEVVGTWHSHPTKCGVPSSSDLALYRATPNMFHAITGTDGTSVWHHTGRVLHRVGCVQQ